MRSKIRLALFMLLLIVLFIGCSNDSATDEQKPEDNNDVGEQTEEENAQTEGNSSKELIVGVAAQPPTLDPHISSASAMSDVTKGIYESLLTLNSKGEIVPQLTESYETLDDGQRYLFKLREGVLFHNGKEMKAEDVVASMNRWTEESVSVPEFLKTGEFKEVDDYEVELILENPSAIALTVLAKDRYYGAILPKEVIDAADASGVQEHIGTGPFKFVEWVPDQQIHITKFEDYVPIDEPADGLSGKKEALVDDIYFKFVSDSSTQVAGVISGEYDIVLGIPGSYYDQLNASPEVDPFVTVSGHSVLFFNKLDGLFEDVKMRQAVNAALDMNSILMGAYGNTDLYDLNSSYEQGFWYSEEGGEFYNENNQEKAKQLLDEAGYNGETITFVTSRDYETHYNQAVVIQEQLKEVGIDVELAIYDWATRGEILEDPENWDLSLTIATAKPTPIEHIYLNQDYVNGPEDEKINGLIDDMVAAPTLDDAKAVWDELQGYLWEYLTAVKIGDTMDLSVTSNKIEGYDFIGGPLLWNVTKSD